MDTTPLTDAQIERYSRQIILPQVGGRGQQRLLQATVSLIGHGPLAEATAVYLAAAGVGTLEIWHTGPPETLTQNWEGEAPAYGPKPPALRRPPPSAGLRRTGPADVSADGPPEPLRSTSAGLRTGSPGGSPSHWAVSRGLAPSALNPEISIRAGSFAAFAPSPCAVFLCANVTLRVLHAVNLVALRFRAPLIAGTNGVLALYAGHDQAAPCAVCDNGPPIHAGSATTEGGAGVVGSLLALEAIKVCLGLSGAGTGRSLHYDSETLTITECPISKRADCGACATSTTTDA